MFLHVLAANQELITGLHNKGVSANHNVQTLRYDPDFLLYKTTSLPLLVISSCVNPSKQVINFMGYHWKSSTIVHNTSS